MSQGAYGGKVQRDGLELLAERVDGSTRGAVVPCMCCMCMWRAARVMRWRPPPPRV